ncbi:MAG: hypothetical protein ACYCSF_13300 [Acidimicrobiales bacterium]
MKSRQVTTGSKWAGRAGIGACALAVVLAVPASAGAQALHSGTRHAAARSAHKQAARQKKVRFSLNGLVQSKTSTKIGVYVANGEIGGKHVRDVLEQVTLQAAGHKVKHSKGHAGKAKRAARALGSGSTGHDGQSVVVGDVVHVSGNAEDNSGTETLYASHDSVVNTKSTAIVGTITSVSASGTTIEVSTESATPGGDNSQGDPVTVDTSQATVLLDGATSTAAALAAGETVAVIGEKNDGTMVASTVLAYDNSPAIAMGTITGISSGVVTLSTKGDSGTTTSLDATSASIYVNGVSGGTLGQLQIGDEVIALGTSGTSSLTLLDFNSGDNHPTGDNNGDQGSQFKVVAGTVSTINGTTFTVVPVSANGNASGGRGNSGDGQRGADQNSDTTTVDASQATVLLNGASSSVSALSANDVVVVIGTDGENGVVAASVLAYSPGVAITVGRLTAVSGSTLTVSSGENDSSGATSVDASTASIYLDGVANSTVSQLHSGDLIIAVGTTGTSGGFSATAVIAFDQQGDS